VRLQLSAAALLVACGASAPQATQVRLDTMFYHDSDHVDVISPQVAAAAALDDDGGAVSAIAVVDVVTAASVDVVSEATPGFTEVREEVDLRVAKRVGTWLPAARYRYSHEPDYVSHGAGVSFAKRIGGADTTLTASLDVTHDTVGRSGTDFDVFSRSLWTVAGEVGVTQIVDPRTVVRAVYTLTVQDGYLAKPYRYVPLFEAAAVAAAGDTLGLATFDAYRLPERPPENVPELRVRSAIGLRGLRYLAGLDGSLRLDYRLYFDDWGMWSHTLELGLRVPFGERWLGELTSRTTYQTSVWFWQREYVVPGPAVIPEWRTVDKELSSQLAETLGLRAEWRPGRVALEAELAATYDRFFDFLFLDSRTALVARLGLRYEP
jgi:hypothetical protein